MNIAEQSIRDRLDMVPQRELVEQVREVIDIAPLYRPTTPSGQPMRVRVSAAGQLGWTGDERGYRYVASQPNGKPWPYIPPEWIAIADRVAGPHPWDSAIINWFDEVANLGWHRDLAEHDHSLPIVTIALGDAASWAMRLDERSPIHRTRLESGDVTLLSEELGTRLALHTIERIIPAPIFRPGTRPGRISITLRCAGRPS